MTIPLFGSELVRVYKVLLVLPSLRGTTQTGHQMDTMTHWASDKALARSHPEISEEFLAKNPKAFRTIQQSLMEAFGARQAWRTR